MERWCLRNGDNEVPRVNICVNIFQIRVLSHKRLTVIYQSLKNNYSAMKGYDSNFRLFLIKWYIRQNKQKRTQQNDIIYFQIHQISEAHDSKSNVKNKCSFYSGGKYTTDWRKISSVHNSFPNFLRLHLLHILIIFCLQFNEVENKEVLFRK